LNLIHGLEAQKEYHDFIRWNFLPKSVLKMLGR